jgi:hypothetical protein
VGAAGGFGTELRRERRSAFGCNREGFQALHFASVSATSAIFFAHFLHAQRKGVGIHREKREGGPGGMKTHKLPPSGFYAACFLPLRNAVTSGTVMPGISA